MLLNLSDVLSRDEKVVSIEAEVELNSFQSRLGSFPLVDKTPLSLTVSNTGNKVLEITGTMELGAMIPCSRCLEDVKTMIHLDILRKIDMKLSEEDRIKELDEDSYITGYTLDVEALFYDELLSNWPMRVVCSDDCKGICSKCGANLNKGECGCDRTVLDPLARSSNSIPEFFKTLVLSVPCIAIRWKLLVTVSILLPLICAPADAA